MRQKLLFEDTQADADLLSYRQATELLNVSRASISNWIKAGYLQRSEHKGYLKRRSFDTFCQAIVGNKKLNARANKQHAHAHDHHALKVNILAQVWHGLSDKEQGDRLAESYEGALSNAYKNKEGIYYTPMSICRDLMERAGISNTITLCDPCCGSGNFLIAALEAGVHVENLAGYDVDAVALEIARRRIFDRTGYKLNNLLLADFLSLPDYAAYDMLITNPPWGKKYTREQKQTFANRFGLGQSVDSCSLFAMAMLKSVKPDGKIGLILPESFFNVKSFNKVRNKVLARQLDFLIDLGKAFDGLVTKTHAMILSNRPAISGSTTHCISGATSCMRRQERFTKNPFSIINFTISELEANAIDKMLNTPHTTLKEKARWGLGIVTGNNKKHLSNSPHEGFVPVFKGADINKIEIKQPTHYIKADFSQYQQVAPLDLYEAPHKIIYKFISSDIVFFHDDKQRFILNSANMLIIDENRLVKTGKLTEYFNLDVINWFHKKLFNTHKILRSNLECVPIYLDYLENTNHLSNQLLLDYLGLERISGTYRAKS